MKYSIVIGAYEHFLDCTKPCLEKIMQYTDLTECEVIVVANGCTDGTEDYVRSLGEPFKVLSFSEPLGYARANNEGIAIAQGEKIILLNNDAFLLEQPKSQWLKMLEKPFNDDHLMGVTGPHKEYSAPGGRDFIVFFCCMTRKYLLEAIATKAEDGRLCYLDEGFEIGGGEDTSACYEIEALGYKTVQVPEAPKELHTNYFVGGFPIYHSAEATVGGNPEWQAIFDRNSLRLAKKYNPNWYRWKLTNNFERAVVLKDDALDPKSFESLRYAWAAQNLKGKKVLEFGCSSGYALKFLPEDVDYTGVDYDERIIGIAQSEFGSSSRKFIHCDANKFEFTEHYDTIIAFEFLEHILNGKEFAQKLKQHCDVLLCSTPYREVPGTWGQHHLLHRLSQRDFPNFEYTFINSTGHLIGRIEEAPVSDTLNLMLMKWEKDTVYAMPKPSILAFIPTRNRYESLAHTIQSIALQTYKPDRLLIYDDGEHRDLRLDSIYIYLFKLLDMHKISWEVIFGNGGGQHFGHEIANNKGYDFVWRIDDDEVASPNVLQVLIDLVDETVGAVAGAVITPGGEVPGGTSKLDDIFSTPNIQWHSQNPATEVEHLYSSFLYRAGVAHYNLELSPVAHREETLFTLALKDKWYKLLFTPEAVTYHFRQEKGGIRDKSSVFLFEHDNRIFLKYLETMGIKVISLDTGLGDHLSFLNIVPDLLKKYKKLIIGCCYPDVFKEYENIKVIPVGATKPIIKEHIYKFCIDHKWDRSIVEAYREMFGV